MQNARILNPCSQDLSACLWQLQWAEGSEEVINSQGMVDQLQGLESAIGYVESSQGIKSGKAAVANFLIKNLLA